MRALKIAVIVMGVLIVAGTAALVVVVLRRSATPLGGPLAAAAGLPAVIGAVLQEPAGTHIAGIAGVQDRLAVQLQGGGLDRVILIDPRTGAVAARVSLAR
ncbi:hypothetical protein [Rhodopila sp.]|uniref:hypothetical protein n=1 Tax=Rhodopila sp. TaxID=2480087 RepID=UPI003D1466FB